MNQHLSIEETGIQGLYVVNPASYKCDEDLIVETYNSQELLENGLDMTFVQENQSMSVKGVLRGLHVQKNFPQGKLVRVVRGKIYDVAVDTRTTSSTYGDWYGVELSADNKKQFYIPEGFAHGFYVISDIAVVCFKVSDYWHPNDEIGIPWNDPELKINWPIKENEIKAMYEALSNMGLSKGNVLEPSCGVGNFMGLVPESISSGYSRKI